jgi:cobalt-zinc-cadmium efflux system protein
MNRRAQHQHHHPIPNWNRAFALGVSLNLIFVAVEAGFGFAAESLALLTDAAHNLGDVLGLLLAWGANTLASRQPSLRHTYGFSRTTIYAGLISGLLLMAAVGGIAWEALGRFMEPAAPAGLLIMGVAAVGVVINTLTALLFLSGKDRDLNIRGAFLHMAADAAVSLGVVLSGAVIFWLGWAWVDPAVSLLIAIMILLSSWGLLRDSAALAVDAVPRHIDPTQVRAYLQALPGVTDLHDLHIWAMSTTETAMTAHLVMDTLPDTDRFLNDVARELAERFEIQHATIQLERGEAGVQCGQSLNCAH